MTSSARSGATTRPSRTSSRRLQEQADEASGKPIPTQVAMPTEGNPLNIFGGREPGRWRSPPVETQIEAEGPPDLTGDLMSPVAVQSLPLARRNPRGRSPRSHPRADAQIGLLRRGPPGLRHLQYRERAIRRVPGRRTDSSPANSTPRCSTSPPARGCGSPRHSSPSMSAPRTSSSPPSEHRSGIASSTSSPGRSGTFEFYHDSKPSDPVLPLNLRSHTLIHEGVQERLPLGDRAPDHARGLSAPGGALRQRHSGRSPPLGPPASNRPHHRGRTPDGGASSFSGRRTRSGSSACSTCWPRSSGWSWWTRRIEGRWDRIPDRPRIAGQWD